MGRLYGEYDYTFEDTERTKGMAWVQKYTRMKHVVVFKMSHDVLQVFSMITLLNATYGGQLL
jgi:cell cycle serine/threonine-protein kinase CDC5/MSD2